MQTKLQSFHSNLFAFLQEDFMHILLTTANLFTSNNIGKNNLTINLLDCTNSVKNASMTNEDANSCDSKFDSNKEEKKE